MARSEINNTDDVLDSRDIIERFEELDGEHDDLTEAITEAQDALDSARSDLGTAQHALFNANNSGDAAAIAEATAECQTYEQAVDEASEALAIAQHAAETWDDVAEWKSLKSLCEQGEGCADWQYGETLVHDSYFAEYTEELAKETSDVPSKYWNTWPFNCIDWDEAASTLKQDYTSIDFDGQTYWIRS